MPGTMITIASLLISRKLTLATAESCTGGLISGAITSLAGASAFFKGAVVAYDNQVKMELLNVSEKTLVTYGAVSGQTVEEMVCGACTLLHTDCAVSVSGIAGPGGGTTEKPVGLVYIGLKINNHVESFRHEFHGNREQVRQSAVNTALLHLLFGLRTLLT